MPIVMQCPFFKKNDSLKLHCEGGIISFPDKEARRDYVVNYCANELYWHKCTICRNLENYYERKDAGEWIQ